MYHINLTHGTLDLRVPCIYRPKLTGAFISSSGVRNLRPLEKNKQKYAVIPRQLELALIFNLNLATVTFLNSAKS